MKILAIRGRNLASLAGDFALDLQSRALGGAGLFVITGPTGAGKSTLLDAMCLALFDRTPRLRGHGVLVGRPDEPEDRRLAAGDTRQLLRRGATAGFAEVNFVGKDSRRYRARWSVRRARDRADGRCQAQTVELRELESGRALGGTKTETLAAIREKLGLGFEETCRSVLLAQGEFAAFLKADAKDRAELLERLTGTELYGALSIAAHERARVEQARLDGLLKEQDALAPLGDQERAALVAARQAGEADAATATGRLEAARTAAAWHEVNRRLAGEEQAGTRELEAAERALAAAEPARRQLDEAEAAQEDRGRMERLDAAVGQAAGARQALARATEEAERAAARQQEAAKALLDGQTSDLAAREALAAAQPALADAVRIDAELAVAARDLAVARERAQGSREVAGRAVAEAAGLERDLRQLDEGAAGAAEWLAAHAELEPLGGEWPRWRAEIERYDAAMQDAAGALADRAASWDCESTACEELAGAGLAERAAQERAEAAERTARETVAALAAMPPGLAQERQQLLVERDAAREAGRRLIQAAEQRALAVAATNEAYEAGEKATREQRALQLSAVRLDELERSLELVRAARDLEEHRARLVAGQPCPLCGACQHPFAKDAPAGAHELERRLRLLRDEHGARQKTLGKLESHRTERLQAAERAAERATAEEQGLAALVARHPRLRTRAEEASEIASRAEARLAEIAAQEVELDRRRLARDAAAGGADQARRLHAAAQAALADAERAVLRAREQGALAGRMLARASAVMTAAREALAPAFARFDDRRREDDWRVDLAWGPAPFAAWCERAVHSWQTRRRIQTEAVLRRGPLAESLAVAQAVATERTAAADLDAKALRDRERAHAALARARQRLIGGRAVADVQQELARAAEQAAASLEQLRLLAAGAAQAMAASASARGEADKRFAAARAELALAETALVGRDLDRLRALLEIPREMLAAQRTDLAGLARRLDGLRAVQGERRARRLAHQAGGAPALGPEEASAACTAAASAGAAADVALAAVRVRLGVDDDRRRRLADLAPRIDAQRDALGTWQALADLIGSADGKKLRVFAQGLTLDALLGAANERLSELARRYRLMRVPGHDMELQVVDAEMGDEVRSVNSLSGGETFLVSLALALALAGLAARGTQIETLFIDEGFGTLDPDALELALAALDTLQAGGRQIGLISHVPGLAERIGRQVRIVPRGNGKSTVQVQGEPELWPREGVQLVLGRVA